MLAVKITVLRDHLRLDPDTEFHSEVIDSFYQSAESLSKLLLIDIPVPKTTVVIVTFPNQPSSRTSISIPRLFASLPDYIRSPL